MCVCERRTECHVVNTGKSLGSVPKGNTYVKRWTRLWTDVWIIHDAKALRVVCHSVSIVVLVLHRIHHHAASTAYKTYVPLSNRHKSHVRNLSFWIFLLREANCTQNTKRYIKNMKKTWTTTQTPYTMISDSRNMLKDDEKCETYKGTIYIYYRTNKTPKTYSYEISLFYYFYYLPPNESVKKILIL